MRMKKSRLAICMAGAFLAGALLAGGVMTVYHDEQAGDMDQEKLSKLTQIYEAIEDSFYQEVDEDALFEGAYKGMVNALEDPYSSYMTFEEYNDWKTSVTGEYSGIGITFSEDEAGNFVIVSVEKASPAEKAGLQAGDILLAADGKAYENMDLLSNAIRGKEGTDVEVKYSRDGSESSVVITRENIVQHSVAYEMIDGDTGYIQITSFMESTAADFTEALDAIEQQGAKELVLDLRDNGGGLVDSCIDVADEFLDEGAVVYVEGKDQERQGFDAADGKTELETVVLVNENSASAAEILAAALQDNGIKLVGQNTFGKGVIQSTGELEDGSALKLTIMQYFSPDGNAIHEKGVAPDYEVKNDADSDADAQLQKALDTLKD